MGKYSQVEGEDIGGCKGGVMGDELEGKEGQSRVRLEYIFVIVAKNR